MSTKPQSDLLNPTSGMCEQCNRLANNNTRPRFYNNLTRRRFSECLPVCKLGPTSSDESFWPQIRELQHEVQLLSLEVDRLKKENRGIFSRIFNR